MKGIKDENEIDRVLAVEGLDKDAAKAKAKSYSLGMKQRLGIANALLGNPDIVILDEPTNGLDPQGIADIRHIIQNLNSEDGKTIIVSSHILGELEHTAHRFGIVHEGIIMKELTLEDMKTEKGITNIKVADEDVDKAKEILTAGGIKIEGTSQSSTSLEDFYFGLVGGGDNA